MKRTSSAVLFAALLLSALPSPATANHPQQCGPFCLLHFSKLHQHGPLFNYGPYYGYPPFEPYGPWNSYLQYDPWYYNQPRGHARLFDRFGGFGSRGCHGCGFHAHWLHGGWFRGQGALSCRDGLFGGRGDGHGLFKGKDKGGCSSCTAGGASGSACAASADPHTTDAVARYAGVGDPSDSARFYAALPSLDPTLSR